MSLSLFNVNSAVSEEGERERRKDERESLHDEVLDFVDWYAGVRGDHAEGNHAVRGWSTEDGLDEGHEADLLAEEGVVGLKDLLLGRGQRER